jgi:hypothetical protein
MDKTLPQEATSVEACRNSRIETPSFRVARMYVIFPIVLAVFVLTWIQLRRFTVIWIDRPPSIPESIISGICAWLFLLSIVAWFGGIVFLLIQFLGAHNTKDIWVLIFCVLVTGYGADFFLRARSDFSTRDTQDYLKEAIQFRRSAQSRLDVISYIQARRSRQNRSGKSVTHEALERARLKVSLSKGKELDTQLDLLRAGTSIDVSELWLAQMKTRSAHPFYQKVSEAKIDPNRKRLSFHINFEDLTEDLLKDEMNVLRLNRQVYDFFQTLNTEPFLKPYVLFFDSYFILCRAVRIDKNHAEVFYPFMRVGILIADLRKLEGFYFNPRKLTDIAAVAFNNGAQI